jgi:hypothetical protein
MEGPDLSDDEKDLRRKQLALFTGSADRAGTLLEVGATTACDPRVLAVYDNVSACGGASAPPLPSRWRRR